jgi:predicted RNA binding protein YcfA (HicA-like mRNA interferase family)
VSGRLPRGVSGDQTIKALERKGWRVHRRKGSHYALEHPDFEPTIVVPRHKELRPGTLNQILKTAEISREEFRELLQ